MAGRSSCKTCTPGELHEGSTVAELYPFAFKGFAAREALVGGGTRMSYRQFEQACHRMLRCFASISRATAQGLGITTLLNCASTTQSCHSRITPATSHHRENTRASCTVTEATW